MWQIETEVFATEAGTPKGHKTWDGHSHGHLDHWSLLRLSRFGPTNIKGLDFRTQVRDTIVLGCASYILQLLCRGLCSETDFLVVGTGYVVDLSWEG